MTKEEIINAFIPHLRGRRPSNLPALTNESGKVLPRYVREKVLGLRRENGAMKLKRLTHRHMQIIGMHLEGQSIEQVAYNNRVTISTVSRVLNDPLAQQLLKQVYSDKESEIQALAGKAIGVVRDALIGDHALSLKLRAVDRYVKVRETMLSKEKGPETAEDVIARMLSGGNIIANNVQINMGDKDATS